MVNSSHDHLPACLKRRTCYASMLNNNFFSRFGKRAVKSKNVGRFEEGLGYNEQLNWNR